MKEAELITPDGVRLAYYKAGETDAPAIVLANAVGTSHRFFFDLANALAAGYRVLAWDYRGFPGSDVIEDPARLTPGDHARDLFAILDAERIASAHLVAWCSGAKVIGEAACRAPRRARGLVFINGAFEVATPAQVDRLVALKQALSRSGPRTGSLLSGILPMLRATSEPPRDSFVCALRERYGEAHASELFHPATPSSTARLAFSKIATVQTLRSYLTVQAELDALDLRDRLRSMALPMLFISGTGDTMASPARAKAEADACRAAALILIPGGSHYCFLEQPVEVAEHIRDFVTRAAHAQPV